MACRRSRNTGRLGRHTHNTGTRSHSHNNHGDRLGDIVGANRQPFQRRCQGSEIEFAALAFPMPLLAKSSIADATAITSLGMSPS